MSAYLYPNLPSKAAFKRAIASGQEITASENTPWGMEPVVEGTCTFEGPHYPKPHRFYGKATVKGGKVVKVS